MILNKYSRIYSLMAMLSPCKTAIHSFRRWIFTTFAGLSAVIIILLYYSTTATPKASLLWFRLANEDRTATMRNRYYDGTAKTLPFNYTVRPIVDKDSSPNRSFSKTIREKDLSEEVECSKSCQEAVQRHRQGRLRNNCAFLPKYRRGSKIWDAEGNLRADQLKRLNHLYPIDNSKLIYCSVPKDGCSSWKRILLAVAGHIEDPKSFSRNVHPIFETKIKPLSKYTPSEAERRLKTYKKFLFVREPLQRMLSLFLDKSVDKHEFPFGEDQFEEFLNYILGTPVHGMALGYPEHWAHASFLCLPCDIQYTFIGRLETSKRDFMYIINNFVNKSSQQKEFYLTNVHKTKSTDPLIKKHYFSHVNKTTLERIYKRYELDYKLFSYDKPIFLKNTNR